MPEIRTYTDLIQLKTYEQRLKYLRIGGIVGADTFGFDRAFNQQFYRSRQWRELRYQIIARDGGRDLGLQGYQLSFGIMIHHMNPLTINDIKNSTDYLLNPQYLICCSKQTHNAIHFGLLAPSLQNGINGRRPNDTCPWRR